MTVEIANRLVQLRKKAGLSQEELAEKLGLSRQAVSKWERAEASPDTDNLITLAKLYNMSLDDLIAPDGPEPAESKKEQEYDTYTEDGQPDISFKGGINVNNSDSKVHVGLDGIHVEDADGTVHVGFDGIHVHEAGRDHVDVVNGKAFVNGREYNYKRSLLRRLPVALITVILFLGFGFFMNAWHPAWLLFFIIPIYGSIADAVEHKDAGKIAFPVIITLAYLCIGFFMHAWHPGWVIFLLIPVYYTVFPGRKDIDGGEDKDRDNDED